MYAGVMRDVDSADPTIRAAIPAPALVVKDFVNSADLAAGTDELATAAGLGTWLRQHGLTRAGAEPSEADRRRAVAVREGLRQLLLINAGHAPDATALDGLNSALGSTALVARFDATGGRTLAPAHPGPVDDVLAVLVSAVDQARTEGVWERLKVCARDECRWAYYDASRNRSGRWCSMTDCGNRVKMKRAYAARTGR
jgi:predicted RNA-binding Zn ribbon-like protein